MRVLTMLMILVISYFNSNNKIQTKNLILNGGFDGDPSFINWYSDLGITSKTLGGNPGGYAWLDHEGLDTDPDINQEVKGLSVGTEYLVQGDYRGGDKAAIYYNHPGDTVFAIDIDEREIEVFEMPNPVSKWTKFKTSFIATDSIHILRFRAEINGTDGDIAIDNISILKQKNK